MAANQPKHRALLVFCIKLAHTLVFFGLTASIFYLLYSAIANRITRWTKVATIALALECAALALNRMQCPLRSWAEALGDERGSVTDIFLPRWLADHIFVLCTPLYILGFGGVIYRYFTAAQRRRPLA